MNIRAVIIDDESGAAKSLQFLLKEIDTPVECAGMAHSAFDAVNLIRSVKPEVVFLDVNMPFNDGFDVLDHFVQKDFLVIFVTAHEEHAIRAIRHHAFDYLLKPIDTDELAACMERAAGQLSGGRMRDTADVSRAALVHADIPRQLAIPVKDGVVFISQDDLVRIEGEGSYSTLYTSDKGSYVSSRHLKEFEDMLPASVFCRIHKSHLINIRKVRKYLRTDGHYVEMQDGSVLEVARRRKDDLLGMINAL
jgi:two-component system LytT family response regulator